MVSVLISLVHMCGYRILFVFLIYFFMFMVATQQHMEVPGPGTKSELQVWQQWIL